MIFSDRHSKLRDGLAKRGRPARMLSPGAAPKLLASPRLAVNSVVVAPVTTVCLGCVRGGNYFVPVQLSGDAFSYEAAIP
jgi:hypothetical protein